MSDEADQARLLAERIARRMSAGGGRETRAEGRAEVGEELAVMRASLQELQQRLARIESHVTRDGGDSSQGTRPLQPQPPATRSPWLSGMYVPATAHPSQERFGVEEAAVAELVDFFEGEKKCELEPGGKPCDHCAMCSTRGF
jgi:hypothetical protein